MRLVLGEGRLDEVTVLLQLGIDAVQFGCLDRRDDRRGTVAVLARRELVGFAKGRFKRFERCEVFFNPLEVVTLDAIAHGDVVPSDIDAVTR